MKCRRHKNPPDLLIATVAPILPYALLGGVIYFFGGKIMNLLGAKIAGIDTTQFKSDVKTVSTATTKDVANVVTGNVFQTAYISPAEQAAAIASIKAGGTPQKPETVATKAIKKAITVAIVKPVQAVKAQASNVKAGLKTIADASPTEIKSSLVSGLKGLFSGGIWSTSSDNTPAGYISQDAQKAALARIKAEKGFK
jgi:hypothetical protein